MPEQLSPCPFCGAKAEVITGHSMRDGFFRNVGCLKCRVLFDNASDWSRRTPGPATRAMLLEVQCALREGWGESPISLETMEAFLAEWADTAPSTCTVTIEASPWKCATCGKPVRICDDLQPRHIAPPWPQDNHLAKLSDADLKTLADGLRLSD